MDDGAFDLDGVDDVFALSPAQQGMLYHSEAEPGTGVYVGVLDCTLPDDLDETRFYQAWASVVARHDALRSVFVWAGVDAPLQVVMSSCDITWERPEADLPETDGRLDRDYVESIRMQGLDLTKPPAMRFILGRLPSGQRCFLWVCHHALVDDWSQALVMMEVQGVYAKTAKSEDAEPVPYGVFAEWLRDRDSEDHDAYWQSHFSGFDTPTRLQLQTPLNVDAVPLRGFTERQLDAAASQALIDMARKERVTLASVATAVWAAALHRLSGEDDCAFGLAVTQRPPELGDMDRAIGNFVTTMPARISIDEHPDLRALIGHVHEFVQEAQPRSGIALSRLQQITGQPQDTPLFDSILSIKQDAMAALDAGGTALFQDPAIQFKSNFPFAMVVMPGDEITLRVIYNPKSYTQDAATAALDVFEAALRAAPSSLDAAPSALQVTAPGQPTPASQPIDVSNLEPIHTQILRHADAQPDAPAIVTSFGELSYGALKTRATSLAQRLVSAGYGPGDRVGLYLDRGSDVPVAMLGCLMAGVAYVPFDAAFPQARLDTMIKAARLATIVTTHSHITLLQGKTPILDLHEDEDLGDVRLPDVSLDDAAYVMFTSGSTGQPKGVVIGHGNLAASNAARPVWYQETPDAFLLLSSHAFDSSVVGLYWTLCSGGTLHIPTHDEARETNHLIGMVREERISHMLCLPSVYQLLLDTDPDALKTLKTVIVAGEEATGAVVSAHRSSGLSARLVNEYGPTEATVWSTIADITKTRSDEPVLIGAPIPGARVLVEDSRGRTVPDGVPGELLVAGPGVAQGYFDLPEETAARFTTRDGVAAYRTGDLVRRRSDGTLTYIGRADAQVKLRGYRVELSEIETHLAARQDLRETAVALHGDRLVAYLVANDDAPLNPESMRAYCTAALPDYMVPAQFTLLDSLPRTPNGKVDRKALPAPQDAEPADFVDATTPTESVLAEVWRKVLWMERKIGMTEDFHDLGGHSLIAMRLINEIEQTFDIRVPLARLGRITTVAEQAKLLEALRREPATKPQTSQQGGDTPSVLAGLTDDEDQQLQVLTNSWRAPAARDGFKIRVAHESGTQPPLFFCFLSEYSFNQLADHLGPDQPIYAMRGVNSIIPVTGEEMFEDNMRRAAITYLPEVLELAGDGPIYLGGYCQGATLAMNLAALLTALQKPVATVISIEKSPPVAFPGHVDFIFAENGFLNPYQHFDAPEQVWDRRHGSHTFELVPGEYGTVFRPPNILQMGAVIRKRLRAAQTATLHSLPRSARAISWISAGLPPRLAPGDTATIAVQFKNDSPHVWNTTDQTGLRVRADWLDQAGAPLDLPPAYGTLFDPVAPGETRSVALHITAPEHTGAVSLSLDMIEEGVAKFSAMGNDTLVLSTVLSSDTERRADAAPRAETAQEPAQEDAIQTARGLIRSGDFAGADRTLHAAALLDPTSDALLLERARLCQSRGQHAKALMLLQKAKRLDGPSLADVNATLAHFYSPRGLAHAVYHWAKRPRAKD